VSCTPLFSITSGEVTSNMEKASTELRHLFADTKEVERIVHDLPQRLQDAIDDAGEALVICLCVATVCCVSMLHSVVAWCFCL
jgi:hypothetical protein